MFYLYYFDCFVITKKGKGLNYYNRHEFLLFGVLKMTDAPSDYNPWDMWHYMM